jgi:hypothetical protein
MKQFYLFYSQGDETLHQLGAKTSSRPDNPPAIFHQLGGKLPAFLVSIPWRHHVEIMTHCKTVREAVFYIQGFAFVGRQVPVQIGRKEYFIDLLFYHLELRCYVVIELKAGEFEAEHTGKLGLYVSAINHQCRKAGDNPTIGLLICKTKDNIVAQYSLESTNQPIGISEYQLSRLLPENYKSALPSIEEIEAELNEKITEPHNA